MEENLKKETERLESKVSSFHTKIVIKTNKLEILKDKLLHYQFKSKQLEEY